MKCKICHIQTLPLFKTTVLLKYQVQYYRCPNCEFIQTEKPHWLNEAYQSPIANLDIGVISRNQLSAKVTYKTILNSLNPQKMFLDYAGGYGLLSRMMRDMGLNFYHYDKYCQNIFAQNYDLQYLNNRTKFEAVTAFEVFEHFEFPIKEIKKILTLTDNVIFSTELIPDKKIKDPNDWWYFVPETGQHIALYSVKTMEQIAKILKLNFYNFNNFHILSKTKFKKNPFLINSKPPKLPSLLDKDFQQIKKAIKKNEIEKVNKLLQNNNYQKIKGKNTLLQHQIKILTSSIKKQKNEYLQQSQLLEKTTSTLNNIYNSKAWKLINAYYWLKKHIKK